MTATIAASSSDPSTATTGVADATVELNSTGETTPPRAQTPGTVAPRYLEVGNLEVDQRP